jgi:antitoxin component of MazEF toxin-antitoxin module
MIIQIRKQEGNRAVLIPEELAASCGFGETAELAVSGNGLLLRPLPDTDEAGWDRTFREMAAEQEDWSDFESTVLDGLDHP